LLAARHADDTLFLAEALAPHEFRVKKQAAFDCQSIGFDELAKQKLGDYAAVCLLDPPALGPELWRSLASFASSGRGVALFLGAGASKEDFNAAPAQELLPAALTFPLAAPD